MFVTGPARPTDLSFAVIELDSLCSLKNKLRSKEYNAVDLELRRAGGGGGESGRDIGKRG